MIDFKKPHLVPQSTQSLARGAEADRHRQAKAYDANRANNHRQMDDIRHAQYHKQASAVNKQKTRMQDNAAKASKKITGSSAYYKEQITLEDFLDLCEGRQANIRRARKLARQVSDERRTPEARARDDDKKKKEAEEAKKQSAIVHVPGKGKTEEGPTFKRDKDQRRPAEPTVGRKETAGRGAKTRSIVKYSGPKEEPKEEKPKKTKFDKPRKENVQAQGSGARDDLYTAKAERERQKTKFDAAKEKDRIKKEAQREKLLRQKQSKSSVLAKAGRFIGKNIAASAKGNQAGSGDGGGHLSISASEKVTD